MGLSKSVQPAPKIKTLLAEHNKHRPAHTLREALGDGYLLAKNPLYASIRKKSLSLGFRFSNQNPFHHHVAPLLHLNKFFESRLIPYYPNLHPVRTLEHSSPGKHDQSIVELTVLPNRLLHEAAHSIAHHELFGQPGIPLTLKACKGKKLKNRLVRIFLSESFANSADLLAGQFVQDRVHRFFLGYNSFHSYPVFVRRRLKKILQNSDPLIVIRIVFYGFLYANFLCKKLDPKNQNRILRIVQLPYSIPGRAELDTKISKSDLKFLFNSCLMLNPVFRGVTNQIYLNLLGHRVSVFKALDFNFIEIIEKDPELLKALDRLCLLLLPPTSRPTSR